MNSPVIHSFYNQLIGLLPSFYQTVEKLKKEHFTRRRKLPLPRLIVTLLHLAASGSRHDGVDIKLGDFSTCRDAAGFGQKLKRHIVVH